MSAKRKLDPMTHVILGAVTDVTAPLHAKISNLEAWSVGDARKIKYLCAMLVRADTALAVRGVDKKSPVRVNINHALKNV